MPSVHIVIEALLHRINEITGGNQFMAAAISAWLLAIATFLFRKVPQDILGLVNKHLTTSMTMTSNNESYYILMAWFESKGYSKKFRRIKIVNGRWGGSFATKAVGYGQHLMWYGRIPLMVDLKRIDTVADRDKEEITLTKLGRSHKLFDTILQNLRCPDESCEMTKIKMFSGDGDWNLIKQPKRNLDSILMSDVDKDKLVRTLRDFQEQEQWYIKHGIPYQLGILLHGPPGTGKTSLIRAIAAHLNQDMAVIPASSLSSITEVGTDKELIVIEDVDSNEDTIDRDKKQATDSASITSLLKGGVAEILNALDGIAVSHGRVIIMTTNHIEKLDPALVRPGRVDLKLFLGYVTPETLGQFVKTFFPQAKPLPAGKMTMDITVAELQNQVMLGSSLDTILANCYSVQA